MYKNQTRGKHAHRSEFDLYHDFENIKDAFTEATYDVKGRAGEILSQSMESLKDKSSDLKDGVEEYVSNKPFQSMGIALLAGMVIGYFIHK